MPTGCSEPLQRRLLGRRFVEMVGLRIEFGGKALDVFAGHGFVGTSEAHAHSEIVEPNRHRRPAYNIIHHRMAVNSSGGSIADSCCQSWNRPRKKPFRLGSPASISLFISRSRLTRVRMNSIACAGSCWIESVNSLYEVAAQVVSILARTVADRGPGSIRHISPKTSPELSVASIFSCAPLPRLTST